MLKQWDEQWKVEFNADKRTIVQLSKKARAFFGLEYVASEIAKHWSQVKSIQGLREAIILYMTWLV